MCKYAIKKLSFLIRYVLDQFKTQQMYGKAISENDGTLKFVPDCSKDQHLCNNKTLPNYPHALEFVPECYKTHKVCYKALYRCFLYLILFLINIKLKKYVT